MPALRLSDVRKYISSDPGMFASDDVLRLHMNAINDRWELDTNRLWGRNSQQVDDCYICSIGMEYIRVERLPITIVHSVEFGYSLDSLVELSSDEWEVASQDRGTIARKISTDWRVLWEPGIARVTYDGGLSETPSDVQLALVTQIRFQMMRLNDPNLIMKEIKKDDAGSAKLLDPDMHPMYAAAVDRYRRLP